jgi:hypothetical protein
MSPVTVSMRPGAAATVSDSGFCRHPAMMTELPAPARRRARPRPMPVPPPSPSGWDVDVHGSAAGTPLQMAVGPGSSQTADVTAAQPCAQVTRKPPSTTKVWPVM